jgi:glycosyltransferase involved in cell wall biosynthesis
MAESTIQPFFLHMKKSTILFLDNTYPQAYQQSTLKEKAIGGTESSIIKTASILSKHYKVFVAQKSRTEFHIENTNLTYIPKIQINKIKPDYIIVLRKYPLLKELKKQFPKARLFLWIHTYKNIEYAFKRIGISKTKTTIICNSKTHAISTEYLLNKSLIGKVFSLFCKSASVKYCYNPVDKPVANKINRDPNKLLFFSSPNKGLKEVIESFLILNKIMPNLRLYIANPGYKNDTSIQHNANIVILGSLPHKRMMQHVKQSLCIFYPQNSFAETFGLIYAEANAYGTPVLAYDIGSAKEILHRNNGIISIKKEGAILKTIKKWQNDFPKIEYNENFSDKTILAQWQELFS